MSDFNSHKRVTGSATALQATEAVNIIAGVSGKIIYLKKLTVVCTLAATGSGAGIITIRDGAAGTVITQMTGETLNQKIDLDLDDGLGYPLTAGNALSLEVSAATTNEATAIAYAVCSIEY